MGSGREPDPGLSASGPDDRRGRHPGLWRSVDSGSDLQMEERSEEFRTSSTIAGGFSMVDDELRELLGIAFECFPIGAAIVALDGRFLHVNPTFCEFLGRSADELQRHQLADFIDADERSSLVDLTASILDRGVDNYRESRSFIRPDGRRVRLDMTGAVLKSPAGHKRAILALAHPVSEDTAGNAPDVPTATTLRSIIPTALELIGDRKSLRDEFESFCRTISQEFRNPLRVIEGYAEIVLEDCGSTLDGMTRRHLQTIRDQSRRLSALVETTLSLARITSRPLRREHLDLSAIALDAAAVVSAELHEHDVDTSIQPDLAVDADAGLMGQLLRELFQNAFRFSRGAGAPCVEFGQDEVDGSPAFFVRDNGCGFDMALAYKLFVPFETLHEGSEAAGSGVGLAEAERIVRRHGGQIWAEAAPGRGATFYFTIPEGSASESPPNS